MDVNKLRNTYCGKRVFITGHTGFKGSWLCQVLLELGADVYGYALEPPTIPSLYDILNIDSHIHSTIDDIRNLNTLKEFFCIANPDYVVHLAAQPLVHIGYADPLLTYSVNVMGTLNILECIRNRSTITAFLNVTTDKVYHNNEWEWGYRETDVLDGIDPYANSKSCSELVTASYFRSYKLPPVFSARAGNVIGGGDFSDNRIIPDCFRAASLNKPICIRNPNSTRPYQHVLDCLFGYLLLLGEPAKEGSYNIGPEASDCLTTLQIAEMFSRSWGNDCQLSIAPANEENHHESRLLHLDTSRIRAVYGWKPKWDAEVAVEKSVEWYKAFAFGRDLKNITCAQIYQYMEDSHR